MQDKLNSNDGVGVALMERAAQAEAGRASGTYVVTCWEPIPEVKPEYDVAFQRYLSALERNEDITGLQQVLDAFPKQKVWEEPISNVVATVGKNLALDTILAGSSYTVVGPYMGLISSASWSAVAAGDTMTSHSGWLEAGSTNAPTFAARGTPAWSSASAGSKSTSAAVSFTMTGSGTLKGAFLVYGSGAITTLMSTAGTLLSAGTFTGGDQAVSSGNVVTVTYSLSI